MTYLWYKLIVGDVNKFVVPDRGKKKSDVYPSLQLLPGKMNVF